MGLFPARRSKASEGAVGRPAPGTEPADCRREVSDAIDAAKSGERSELDAAFEALAPLEAGSVFIELFLRVEDAVEGVDLDELIGAAELPLPDHPREIVAAVQARDMRALEAATSPDALEVILASLVLLVASLGDARTRV